MSCQPAHIVDSEPDSRQNATSVQQNCSVDYATYQIPESSVSEDQMVRYVDGPGPNDNIDGLRKLLEKQASLPPRPIVHIKGTHVDYVYSWGNLRIDFDLRLDITPLIAPPTAAHLTQVNFSNVESSPDESLRHWIQRFYNGQEDSLTLKRRVTNWNTALLEDSIRDLIQSTRYKGIVDISFLTQHSKIVVLRPGLLSASTRSRYSNSSLSELAGDSKCVIESIWPYASVARPFASNPYTTDRTESRVFTVQSEAAWFDTWREPIRNAILGRRQGWITLEDWKDVTMGYIHRPQPTKSWGTISDDWSLAMQGVNLRGRKQVATENFVRGMHTGTGTM